MSCAYDTWGVLLDRRLWVCVRTPLVAARSVGGTRRGLDQLKCLDCALCALQGISFGLFLTRGAGTTPMGEFDWIS